MKYDRGKLENRGLLGRVSLSVRVVHLVLTKRSIHKIDV